MRHECAHHSCHCEVAAADQFCSESCREAAMEPRGAAAEALSMTVCGCGHLACLKHEEGDRHAAP